jgi:hypothetical protein
MKKIIAIVVILLCFSNSYGQDKPCPTKDETMDWIAGKMKKYLQSPRTFESYSNGIFKYRKLSPYDDGSYGGYNIITIDLNKLTSFEGDAYSSDYVTKFIGNNICSTVLYDEKNKYSSNEKSNDIEVGRNSGVYSVSPAIDFYIEDGLGLRMIKALKCLMQYTTKTADEKF